MHDYHSRIPREPRANLRRRLWVIRRCKPSRARRRALESVCKRDIVAFADLLVFQFNPDNYGDEIGPWVTWDWQADVLRRTMARLFRKGRSDMLWEKSREMGATWLAVILAIHLCLFSANKRVLCLSHKEEAIYKPGDNGTLFAKIQFIIDRLPSWLSAGIRRKKLSYQFPNGSTISGAATTDAAGVGDRVSLIILDEFSKYRQKAAYDIWGATADTGPRLVIGTHYGVSGCYYDLTQRADMPKEVMHWTLHPDKVKGLYRSDPNLPRGYEVLDHDYVFPVDYPFVTDGRPHGGPRPHLRSPWYDAQCLRRANDRDVAQHLDIAPAQSQHNYFDSVLVATLQEATADPVWEGTLILDPATAEFIGLRPEKGGPVKLWVHPTANSADGLATEVPADRYGMGCDISMGTGASNSVCSIGSSTTGRKVCEVAVHDLDPRDFALACMALGKLFRDYDGSPAMVAWEIVGPGGVFTKTLKEKHYHRMFYRESKDIMRGNTVSDIPGWSPGTLGAKRALLDAYVIALRDRKFVNLSFDAFEDCKAYRYSDTKDTVEHPKHAGGPDPSGARSNHGDRVIADALCWMVMQRLGYGRQADPESPDPRQAMSLDSQAGRAAFHERQERVHVRRVGDLARGRGSRRWR